jgi:glycosyltransferase involved in cell wall biosynthesis
LRILLVCEAFDAIGGIQEVVHRLGTYFSSHGHAVAVANDPKTRGGLRAPGFVGRPHEGFEVFSIRLHNAQPPSLRHPGRAARNALAVLRSPLGSLISRWRPTLVSAHIWNWDLNPAIAAACRDANVPLTFSLHGFGGRGSLDARALDCLSQASAVIANSRGTRDAYSAVAPHVSDAHVVVGGVDVEAAEQAEPYVRERPYILCPSRIELRYKRFDMLLSAFREVAPAHPLVDLLIAGDGPDRAQVEALAGEFGLAGRVEFLGSRKHSELWPLYKGAELTLMPGLGLVGLESIATRTPVVGTLAANVATEPELAAVNSENFAIIGDDAPSLARGMIRILDDPQLRGRMGEEGHKVAQQFGWPRICERYLELFESCLARA